MDHYHAAMPGNNVSLAYDGDTSTCYQMPMTQNNTLHLYIGETLLQYVRVYTGEYCSKIY